MTAAGAFDATRVYSEAVSGVVNARVAAAAVALNTSQQLPAIGEKEREEQDKNRARRKRFF